MNHISLTRTEAEYLVKLLSREKTDMADQLIEQLAEAFGNTVKCAIEDGKEDAKYLLTNAKRLTE